MRDHNPTYAKDDLLALYTFTGGVPKYVELFCDNTSLRLDDMIHSWFVKTPCLLKREKTC